jgi:hypothetical protein
MLVMMMTMLLGIAVADSSLGEGRWCWQPASSTVMFCDYSSFSTCMAANSQKEMGACFRR